MDVDMDGLAHAGADERFQLPPLCPVCAALDAADNGLLTEYVVAQARTSSLTSTVLEARAFYATIQSKNLTRCKSQAAQQAPGPATMTTDDIMQHVFYCIAPHAPIVGRSVLHTIVIKSVLTAKTHAQVLASAKLMLQTQGPDKPPTA